MEPGVSWNPWHGCVRKSEGCRYCYVYRMDAKYGRDPAAVFQTKDFDLPVRRHRDGSYVVSPGQMVYTCFSSDFLLDIADPWRPMAWDYMAERRDVRFMFITKRIERLAEMAPPDWGEGYAHVTICCTTENQKRADERLPIYLEAPVAHRHIICEPLLGPIDLKRFLGPWIEGVTAGGESGPEARVCDYRWILSLRQQCQEMGVPFHFKQTGARLRKDGRVYQIPRRLQHIQARRAGIDIP